MLSTAVALAQYVSCIVDGADDRRRHRGPRAAAVPLRPAALLPHARGSTSARRTSCCPAPTPAAMLRRHRGRAGHEAVLPADGLDLAAAATRIRHPRPVLAAQGLLRRVDHAGRGAQGDRRPAAGHPALQLLRADRDGARWPPSCSQRTRCARPARPGAPRSTSRPGWSTTTTTRCRPARSARSCTAARTRCSATGTTRTRTADAFRSGWFHSGDLGVLDEEGYLSVVDRKKDMIKTGGENVASREVEEAIYQHPAVAEVAVFGLPHPLLDRGGRPPPSWSEGGQQAVTPQELIAFCRDAARRRSRRPSTWSSSDSCPRTPAASCSNANCAAPSPRPGPDRHGPIPEESSAWPTRSLS